MDIVNPLSKVDLMEQAPTLPKPFDPNFYRATYAALANFSDAEAERHYQQYGIGHGLIASPRSTSTELYPTCAGRAVGLGNWSLPCTGHFRASGKYLDAYNKEELVKRAKELGLDPTGVPSIDYVSPTGTFEMVDRKFSAAFGSHSIEHQPDFIQHLFNVSSVLEAEGRYYMYLPDKRVLL